MQGIHFFTIIEGNKTLGLTVMNNHTTACDFELVESMVNEEFKILAPYIKSDVQFIYIRDNVDLTIEGHLPAGHTYFPTESMIAVPSWHNYNEQELQAVIAHELHHMARSQNVGYGSTLGEVLASEGFATYYEEIRSGRKAEWAKVAIPESAKKRAIKDWVLKDYNHNEWFFDGPDGKWIGYSLGLELVKNQFPTFDLGKSITNQLIKTKTPSNQAMKYIRLDNSSTIIERRNYLLSMMNLIRN